MSAQLVPEHRMDWPVLCAVCGRARIEEWVTGPDGNPVGLCGYCEPDEEPADPDNPNVPDPAPDYREA